jgi:integrase
MKVVDPIKNSEAIETIKKYLVSKWDIRWLLLFELWINSAVRISDLLELKVKDVFTEDLQPVYEFSINDEKTGKQNKIDIVDKVIFTLQHYKKSYPILVVKRDNYLFFPEKYYPRGQRSLSRQGAHKLINKRTKEIAWLQWLYWGHTLRKTRWYMARKKWLDIWIIMAKLNHSSERETMRYIGITQDEVSKATRELNL